MKFAAFLLLVATPVWAGDWQGQARVHDGDTLIINGIRLRLISLDAPEGGQTCRDRSQVEYDCGQEATRELQRLIGGREVTCSGNKLDRYKRPLVVCRVGDTNLNAALVRSGWAVTYLGRDFVREETDARVAKRGLWAGEFQPPVDWRKDHRPPPPPPTKPR